MLVLDSARSCKYREQCRFVHANCNQQQQVKPNPFGFGTMSRQQAQQSFGTQSQHFQQQQKPNHFVFKVQGGGSQQRNEAGPAKDKTSGSRLYLQQAVPEAEFLVHIIFFSRYYLMN